MSTATILAASKAKFDSVAVGARWLGTNGLRFFLQFWYSKRPMFWLPKGLAPGYIEWFLAFPRAPTGSISIQLWGIACAAAISICSDVIVAGMALAKGEKTAKEPQAQAFEMKGQMPTKGAGKSRKEL